MMLLDLVSSAKCVVRLQMDLNVQDVQTKKTIGDKK